MRNHSFLYLLRPDGEEGELQRIGESNSVFPSLWKILLAGGRAASTDVLRVLRGTATRAIQADAADALRRYGHVKDLLSSSGAADLEGLCRYLDGAARHLQELVDDWSLVDAAQPVFCADFDEMSRPHGADEDFLSDRLAEHERLWRDIERLGSQPATSDIESLLDFRASNLRFTDWRAWSGLFGLALFEHDYFQKAFRQPFRCAYADYEYDPLGSDDDLGGGMHRFRANGRWGVRSLQGSDERIVLAAEWDRVLRAGDTEPDVVWVRRDGRFGLAAVRGPNAGALLVPPELTEVGSFEDGAAPVRVASKMGFLRADGSWLLAPAWDRVWPFRGGRALVETEHHLTYIDTLGTSIVETRFDEAGHFGAHGVARVGLQRRYGLLRSTGELALEIEYSSVEWSDIFQGWLCERSGLFSLVHADGGRWLDDWERIDVGVPQAAICVRRGGRFGLLDWSGHLLLDPEYRSIEPLHPASTLLLAMRDDCVGVVDSRGAPIVPFEFSRIEPLTSGSEAGETGIFAGFLLVYSLPDRARPKAGVWDLDRGCLRAPCQYDRETLPEVLERIAASG